MKLCFLTHQGLERFCSEEIEQKLGASTTQANSIVVITTEWDTTWKAIFTLQTPTHMGILLHHFTFTDLDQFAKEAENVDIKEYITKATLINTECIRRGSHDFSSEDVKVEVGRVITRKHNLEVNYKSPNVQIFVYVIDDHCYITLDLLGKDASKRLYKVFHHTEALKGTVAASLLQFSDYTKEKTLIDPFAGSGIIPIEAALSSLEISQWNFHHQELLCTKLPQWELYELSKVTGKLPLFGYDHQFRHINTAKKNAKLAGVDKAITISRVDVEWLETKHKENSVDLIVTHPPETSKSRNENDIKKVHQELFHQAHFILKPDGRLTAILRRPEDFKKLAKNFQLVIQHDFQYGAELLSFVKLKKS